MSVVLISTYELGRQPFGLASPAAWLAGAGLDVRCVDLSRQPFDPEYAEADLVAFHLPMHTATRLAVPVIARIRRLNPDVELCCYGLYAPLNDGFLRSIGVSHILGVEFEADLLRLASGRPLMPAAQRLPRLEFINPLRASLPPLTRYATLQQGTTRRIVGYTEASRGCKHTCRHCPIVPVYGGQFRVVPPEVVAADVAAQVEAGAEHITFGDPDFFNGVGHARRVVETVARRCPGLTYDATIKVEHLLEHADILPELRDTGCLFVTSAVESFDDMVLQRLEKGHTRHDVERAVDICRRAGVPLVPTFIAFTPWTTCDAYRNFLFEIDRLELVDHVAPIQLAIRLLVTAGSRLLELGELRSRVGTYDEERLLYPWRYADERVEQLAEDISAIVGRHLTASRRTIFKEIWARAHAGTTVPPFRCSVVKQRVEVPYLNEPWYC